MKQLAIIPLLLVSLLALAQPGKAKKFKGTDLITVVKNIPLDSLHAVCRFELIESGYSIDQKSSQTNVLEATKVSSKNYTHKLKLEVKDSLVNITGEAVYGGWAFPVSYFSKYQIAHVAFEEMDEFLGKLKGTVYYGKQKNTPETYQVR